MHYKDGGMRKLLRWGLTATSSLRKEFYLDFMLLFKVWFCLFFIGYKTKILDNCGRRGVSYATCVKSIYSAS